MLRHQRFGLDQASISHRYPNLTARYGLELDFASIPHLIAEHGVPTPATFDSMRSLMPTPRPLNSIALLLSRAIECVAR